MTDLEDPDKVIPLEVGSATGGGVSDDQDDERLVKSRCQLLVLQAGKLPLSIAEGPIDLPKSDNQSESSFLRGSYLFKKQSKQDKWARYYFHLYADTLTVSYHTTEEDFFKSRKRDAFRVSWVELYKTRREDALVQDQIKSGPQVCTLRMKVFTPFRIYELSADTDSQLQEWFDTLLRLLKNALTETERTEKENAVKELEPLLVKQNEILREHYRVVMEVLQQSGLLLPITSGKQKEGSLELQRHDSWRKYYFMLFPDCICMFSSKDKKLPKNVIPLPAVLSLKADEKEPFFDIITPVRRYRLKAKHKEAMEDWVLAIQKNCVRKVPQLHSRNSMDLDGEPIPRNCKVFLRYDNPEKKKRKIVQLKKESILIGRTSSAGIPLVWDKKASRNHARIEMNPARVVCVFDLGSMGGTLVNGKKATKAGLKDGDVITCGETKIEVSIQVGTK